MIDEIYSFEFEKKNDRRGSAILFFEGQRIIGVNNIKIKFDGTYINNLKTQNIEAKIKVSLPPGEVLLDNHTPTGSEKEFEFETCFPSKTSISPIQIETPFGPLKVIVRFLR